LGLLSTIYGKALILREFVYSSGIKKKSKLPVKVISIGNLTLGGTGKTPAVISVAQEARKRGFKTCILTRGYKGKAGGPIVVGLGQGPVLNVRQAGDEPVLMAERLEGIPVVMDKKRYNAGMFALEQLGSDAIDMFILDDGFQHWALHRDLDILLIDMSNPFGNGKLFPEGILREPLNAIKRSNIVVLTKVDMACSEVIRDVKFKVKEINPDATVYTSHHKTKGLISLSGHEEDLETLRSASVHAFAGIANPSYFKSLLVSNGADIVSFKSLKDHHIYSHHDISTIINSASGLKIITTEKDLVKLRGFDLPDNIYALRIEFFIDNSFYDQIFG